MSITTRHPVYLVKGDDPSLVSRSATNLVAELVGSCDATLIVEEVPEDADMTAVVDACSTPALLADRRVIVVRNANRFRAEDLGALDTYLSSPTPTSALVLVAGPGPLGSRLSKVVKEHGHIVDAATPSGKARHSWLAERLGAAPVKVDRSAITLISERIGDELGALDGVLDALAAAYGEGSSVTAVDVEPYLGPGGTALPWELTDAIDSGDVETALTQLRRLLETGGRHPLVVIATLQKHVIGLLRMDGSTATSESEAAALLGVSPFPAKKILTQSRKLGTKSIARAVRLVAEADVQLRGGSALPNEVILEVLVARLCRLSPRKGTAQFRIANDRKVG